MRRSSLLSLAALALAACGPVTQGSATSAPADRVIQTDIRGDVIRQNGLNDRTSASFTAPPERVWPAVIAAYADLGLEGNYADQSNGRYGLRNFTLPRNLRGQRPGALFSCGASLTGDLADAGTINAEIITTIAATPEGTTNATFYVTGWVRRNDGNASGPVACSSTGKLEEMLRIGTERKLAEAPSK